MKSTGRPQRPRGSGPSLVVTRGHAFVAGIICAALLLPLLQMSLWTNKQTTTTSVYPRKSPADDLPPEMPRLKKEKSYLYKARIISMNSTRLRRTQRILDNYNFATVHIRPPEIDSPIFEKDSNLQRLPNSTAYARMLQLTYAHKKALLSLAHDDDIPDDGWGFVFEDDVNFHKSITPAKFKPLIEDSLQTASKSGFLYLGVCFPCADIDTFVKKKVSIRGITLGQLVLLDCPVYCTHAYAIKKQRALWLYDEFALSCKTSLKKQPDIAVVDHYFLCGLQGFKEQPWLLGMDLRDNATYPFKHWGIAFQDNSYFGGSTLPHAKLGNLVGRQKEVCLL